MGWKKYDLNGDGCIDMADLDVLVEAFGSERGDPNFNEACDFNGDGLVSVEDFAEWREGWVRHKGQGCD